MMTLFGRKKPNIEPEIAMVYTTMGNLPMSDLDYRTEREDEVDQIMLIEIHMLKGTDTIVKRSVHVLPLAIWQTGKGGRLSLMTLRVEAGALPGNEADKLEGDKP